MSFYGKQESDLIRPMDAISWLDAMANVPPGDFNEQAAKMMKDMAADATNALRKSEDGHGLIQRAKAMEQIKAALPGPPDGLHSMNTGAWFTVRSTFVSAMWYPAAVKED